jgi:two-component system OmpR family sensor kinase
VTVRLRQTPDAATLAVGDDRPGIPPALRAPASDRFARGPQARAGHGAGLGLVTAVAAAHRGSASVTSAPGATASTVTLPGGSA